MIFLSSPRLLIDLFFSTVSRHLPDNALGSEFAVELRIHAFAALIDVETLAACLTESRLMFLADSNRLPVRVISALHLVFPKSPVFVQSSFLRQALGAELYR